MSYPSLEACLLDLEKAGHLVRIKEEVDPNLEMAAIHLRVYEMGGPAILYENVEIAPLVRHQFHLRQSRILRCHHLH